MRILIVEDGLGSYVLPAVRSFGAAGWQVGLGGPRPSRAARSRWVSRVHRVPPAEENLDGFVEAVNDAITVGRYDVVFGGDDVEVLALSATRDRIRATVPYADHDAVVRAIDKLALVDAAQRVGMAAPATLAATPDNVATMPQPVVVKARLHWTPGARTGRGRVAAALCATRDDVERAVAEVEAAGSAAVLQATVEGDLMAVTVLCGPGGEVLAESHQVARRVSPRWRTSTRAETVPVNEELSRQVHALVHSLGWLGIANLQFLRPADGAPQLIDLNGRFYGSLVLALEAGLDLPVLWALLATGADVEPQPPARVGVRYHALEEDLLRARLEHRGGLVADVRDTLRYAHGAAHSTWDARDPKPTATRIAFLGRTWIGNRVPHP